MRNVVRRVIVASLLVVAATTLWIRRADHRSGSGVRPGPGVVATAPLATPPNRLANVVVATRRIEAGDMIEPNFIGVARRPDALIPEEAFSHVDNVMGRVARSAIDVGEVVTSARLAGPFTIKSDPLNRRRIVIVRVDARASDSSIGPNEAADLVVVPGPSEPDRAVETILEDVRVVRIDSAIENRRSTRWYPASIATIEVSIEQQERLAAALASSPWRLALRPHGESRPRMSAGSETRVR